MTKYWDAKNPEVPVDSSGNWMSYPYYGEQEWVRVEPFFAIMEIDGMRTGRSSKVVILKDDKDKYYPMFVADLVKGIRENTLTVRNGKLIANWTASKRGANYGIRSI